MKKLFTLAAAVLFATGMWGELTAHQPGTYEKAVDQGGYGATLVTFSERQYEVYGFSYNSSGSKPQILWAGTSTADASASQVLCSNLSSEVQEIAGWISMSTPGKSSTYSMPENTEFAASSVGSAGLYQMKMQGHTMTLKIKGYDQFSFLGNDNNGDKSKGKYLQVTINGVDSTKDLSSSTTIRRWSLNPSTEYTIAIQGLNTSNEHIDAFSLRIPLPSCEAPETALSIDPVESAPYYVGNTIHFALNGGNGAEKVLTLDGEPYEYLQWLMTEGEHTFAVSQAANGDYCAQVAELKINVLAANPVTEVSVAGPAEGIIGAELVYTATAAGATAYEWYLDDVKQGSDSAKFIYTAVKGEHSIVCKARNQFNATDKWIASAAKAVTITKLCGELIKVTLTNNKAGDLSGVLTGTKDINASTTSNTFEEKTGYKLGGNGQYVGISGLSGTLTAGDTAIVYVTNASANLQLFSDKGTTKIGEMIGGVVQGENKIALNAAATGKNAIYLYRADIEGGGSSMNPHVYSLAVQRPCAESDNNNATVTINGEAAEKSGTVFNYTLSASYEEATVAVEIALEHPLATIMEDHAASFTMATPEVGTPTVETFKVKAENGEQAWYSIFVNKSAEVSHDATLKSLSVTGYTLSPEFAPSVKSYYITKAYGADDPATDKVVYETNHAGATVQVQSLTNALYVTVYAEDGVTHNAYTINIETADAKKDLLEASFSNGANGYISNGNINVPYLAGEAEPTFVAAKFWEADGEPSAEVVEGKLVVTGADSKTAQYTITYVPVTPMEASYDVVTFTEVPSYIYSVYGWASDKGVKFSKDVEEASTHRISEGKDRIYIALPAAKEVILTGGSTGARPIKVTVNGALDGTITSTPAKDATITISLSATKANFIGIESNGSNGDAGFTKLQLVSVPTAIDNTDAAVKAVKRIENGQLFIEKNGVIYNAQGARLQ